MCIIQQQEKFKNVFLKIFLCSENSFEYIRGEAIGVVFLKGSRKSTLSNYLLICISKIIKGEIKFYVHSPLIYQY